MKDTIYSRRSCRSYNPEPLGEDVLQALSEFGKTLRPLHPEIAISWQVLPADQVRFFMPWKSPQLIAFFSENKPGYLENAGFCCSR